jgi:hypothetical protein
MITVYVLLAVLALGGLLLLGSSVRVITQFERGVVLRFGRLRPATRGPGLALIAPFADRLRDTDRGGDQHHHTGASIDGARARARARGRRPMNGGGEQGIVVAVDDDGSADDAVDWAAAEAAARLPGRTEQMT